MFTYLVEAPEPPQAPTFSGDGDGTSWADPANWNTGVVPGVDDDVLIPAGATAEVSDERQVGNIEIAATGSLEILAGGILDVTGTVASAGAVTVLGSLGVPGSAVFEGTLELDGASLVGNVTIGATGVVTFTGNVSSVSGTLVNDGIVVVTDTSLLLAGVAITNTGEWGFVGDGFQDIQISVPNTSTFTNTGTIAKNGSGMLAMPSGFDLDMGDGSVFAVDGGVVEVFAEGTWTGGDNGIQILPADGATFNFGNVTVSGRISGAPVSDDPVGTVIVSGNLTWATPSSGQQNALAFPWCGLNCNSEQLEFRNSNVQGAPFDIEGYARATNDEIFGADVTVRDGSSVRIVDVISVNQSLVVEPGAELRVTNGGNLAVYGSLVLADFAGTTGDLVLEGSGNVFGSGQIINNGSVRKTGSGQFDVLPFLDWISSPAAQLSVEQGVLAFGGSNFFSDPGATAPGLPGEVFLAPGALLDITGNLVMDPDTNLIFEISGTSIDAASVGQIALTGTLTKDGALDAVLAGYAPTPADSYDVITCTDCTDGTFASTSVAPLEVTTTPTTVTLALAPTGPCTTTWTGAAGDGIFTESGELDVRGSRRRRRGVSRWTPATETITIPSGQSVEVLRFESAGQSLVIDGSLTVNELSTLDGEITVNGSLNGVGDIVIANFAEVSGTITGLVTVANGAQLFFLDGTIAGPSTVLTNLGVVVVDGPGLLLDNGVTVDNSGLWEFFTGDTSGDVNPDQTVVISVPGTSTFNNDGVVRKVGDGLTVLPVGFEFNMGDGSAIVVAEGELRLFADGTWTGDELGIDVQSGIGTTFVWAGNQTLSGGINGTSSVDAVGKVVMSGTKTWAVPGGDEPRTNTLDFGHDPTAPASAELPARRRRGDVPR